MTPKPIDPAVKSTCSECRYCLIVNYLDRIAACTCKRSPKFGETVLIDRDSCIHNSGKEATKHG